MRIKAINKHGGLFVKGEIEIPTNVLSKSTVTFHDSEALIDLPTVLHDTPTGALGHTRIILPEEKEETKLDTYNQLINFGFQSRGSAYWYHPFFGADLKENWILFDVATDDVIVIIAKVFKAGMIIGGRNARFDMRKALGIPLI